MSGNAKTAPYVGVIGLGQMGAGIARNLLNADLLVAAWDISKEALTPFDRNHLNLTVSTPREMAERCDTIIFVVPSSNEIGDCLKGPNGVLASQSEGRLFLDLTTSDPEQTRNLAAQAQSCGHAYIDAGMSGGAQSAEAGRLALMCGGERADFERVKPVFEVIADLPKVFHVGPSGAGHAMKLVHNMICHTIFMATAEGCRVAEHAGIDLATALNVINSGNARSYVSEFRFPRHILSGTFDARSRVVNLEKDLKLGVAMAKGMGLSATFSAQTVALLERAVERGMGGDDFSLLYKHFDYLVE